MAALDPSHVFINDARAEVLKAAVTAVREGHAIAIITGADGAGKTTLMQALGAWLKGVDDIVLACRDRVLACSSETTLEAATAVCRPPANFAAGAAAPGPSESGPFTLLLVDDADRLDAPVLAGLKRWVVQAREDGVAMAMIMTITDRGRRARRTEDEQIRAGADREIKLPLLDAGEVPAFVYHALQAKGEHGLDLFSDAALARISFYGNGNPGRIARLCTGVVAKAERTGTRPIPQELVKDVAWTLFVPQHLRKLAAGRPQPESDGLTATADDDDPRLDYPLAEPEPERRPHRPPREQRPPVVPQRGAGPEPPRRAVLERTFPQPAADGDAAAEPALRPTPIVMDQPVAAEAEAAARFGPSAASRSRSEAVKRSRPGAVRTVLVVLLALLIGGATGYALVRTGLVKAGGLNRAWRAVTVEGEVAVSAASVWIADLSSVVTEISDNVNEVLREVGPLDDERYGRDRVAGSDAEGAAAGVDAPPPQSPLAGAEPSLKPAESPVTETLEAPRPAPPAANAPPAAEMSRKDAGDGAADASVAPLSEPPPEESAAADVAPAPAEPAANSQAPSARQQQKSSISAIAAAPLLARGDWMLELGDLASARLFYKVVAEREHVRASMLMGLTFDPVYFRQRGIKGIRPEPEQAIAWYRRAIALGSAEAEQRQRVLVSWLKWRAETGDAAAARTLRNLQ